MTMQDFVRLLRAHWLGVVAIFLLGILTAAGVTAIQPREYTATTSGIITAVTGPSDQGTGSSLAGTSLAQSKVKSYVDMGSWRTVAQSAINALKLKDSPEELVSRVAVTNPLNTTIIQVSAVAPTPIAARDLAQAWLQGMVNQVKQVETTGGSQASVQLIAGDSARLPTSPSSPNWRLNLLIGALAGLAVGVAYGFIRDRNDQRIRSANDVQRVTGQAVVGALPLEPSIEKQPRLLSVDGSNDGNLSILAEAFRSLRTNLQYMSVDNPPRSIVMTSSAPGDGKSFTAANLAVALSATGQDVVLIDGDLRRPKVAQLFGIVGDVGLSDVLAGRASFGDVVQSIPGTSTLHVLASGAIPPNPSEILGSERMKDLIRALSEQSVVIVDTPPLLAVTDAAILSTRTDGTFVVVKTGSTTREMRGLAMNALATVKGKVLGVILNRVPTKGSGKVYYGYRYTGEYYRDEHGTKHHSSHESASGTGDRFIGGQKDEGTSISKIPLIARDSVSVALPDHEASAARIAEDARLAQSTLEEKPITSANNHVTNPDSEDSGSAQVPRRLKR